MPLDRVVLVDDDGSDLTGTALNDALFQLLQDKIDTYVGGTWVTPTFSASDYTASGSMTWTVQSGDVSAFAYTVIAGKLMILQFAVNTTTVGGTPSTELRIAIPGGYTPNRTIFQALDYALDNNVLKPNAMARATVSGTYISLFVDQSFATNWTASTNLTSVRGSLILGLN